MLIAIPSKGRAGKPGTQSFLKGRGVVFVPDLEVDAYRACGTENVVGVPDTVRGITATRNWILENTEERWVVFVDDDVERVAFVEMLSHECRHVKITPEQAEAEFYRLFEVCEDLGFRIWGPSTDAAPRSVYTYRPLIFHTYITASCMGIINGAMGEKSALRFDERFKVKEDYELCLRALEEDGGVLGARYFYWRNKHWRNAGGCNDYRSVAMEEEAIALLEAMYPRRILRKPNKESPHSIQLIF